MQAFAHDETRVFWQTDRGDVYASTHHVIADVDGNPMGTRWECSRAHYDRYAGHGIYPPESIAAGECPACTLNGWHAADCPEIG